MDDYCSFTIFKRDERINMNVVINAFSARQGGGQTYLINLLNHLPVDQTLKVFVFTDKSISLPEDPRLKRVETLWPVANPIARLFWEKFILPFFLIYIKADVLFCPGGLINSWTPKRCHTVTMFRNMIPFDARVRRSIPFGLARFRNFLLHHAMLNSMKKADLTIFISNYAFSIIDKLIPIKNKEVIPHGISRAFKENSLTQLKDLKTGEYFLYVSKFDYYKHHDTVIKSYSMLSNAIKEQYKLVFIGELDSPEYTRCKDLVNKLGLNERVVFLGGVTYKDLPAFYQNAYLNIFASSCENCPNIMLEALASGRPLLSSDIMPMPEFGADNVIYFSPYDELSLKIAFDSLVNKAEIENVYAKKSLIQSSLYDWEKSAKITWNAILKLDLIIKN